MNATYKLVLETTLKTGVVLRDALYGGCDQKLADVLAGNLNASIAALAHADGRTVNAQVIIEPEVL